MDKGPKIMLVCGLVKFVPAVAYYISINRIATFAQPRTSIHFRPNMCTKLEISLSPYLLVAAFLLLANFLYSSSVEKSFMADLRLRGACVEFIPFLPLPGPTEPTPNKLSRSLTSVDAILVACGSVVLPVHMCQC